MARMMIEKLSLEDIPDGEGKAAAAQRILEQAAQSKTEGQERAANLPLTPEQINGSIRAIRETDGEYDFRYIGLIVGCM